MRGVSRKFWRIIQQTFAGRNPFEYPSTRRFSELHSGESDLYLLERKQPTLYDDLGSGCDHTYSIGTLKCLSYWASAYRTFRSLSRPLQLPKI